MNCMCDVIMGVPLQKSMNPKVGYSITEERVDGKCLPKVPIKETNGNYSRVANLGVNTFISLLLNIGGRNDLSMH